MVLLGFRGSKEDFENDPRKNKARRLVAHGIKMMRGGYRLLLTIRSSPASVNGLACRDTDIASR